MSLSKFNIVLPKKVAQQAAKTHTKVVLTPPACDMIRVVNEFTGPTGIRFFEVALPAKWALADKCKVQVVPDNATGARLEFVRKGTPDEFFERITDDQMGQIFAKVYYEATDTVARVTQWFSKAVINARLARDEREARQAEIDDDIAEEQEEVARSMAQKDAEVAADLQAMANDYHVAIERTPNGPKVTGITAKRAPFANVNLESPHSLGNTKKRLTQEEKDAKVIAELERGSEELRSAFTHLAQHVINGNGAKPDLRETLEGAFGLDPENEELQEEAHTAVTSMFETREAEVPKVDKALTRRNKALKPKVRIARVYTLPDSDYSGRYFEIRFAGQKFTFRLEVAGMRKKSAMGQPLEISWVEGGDLDTITDEAWVAIVNEIEESENMPQSQIEAFANHKNYFMTPEAQTPFDSDFPLFPSMRGTTFPVVEKVQDVKGLKVYTVGYGPNKYCVTLKVIKDTGKASDVLLEFPVFGPTTKGAKMYAVASENLSNEEAQMINDVVYEHANVSRPVVTKGVLAMREMGRVHDEMGLEWMMGYMENLLGARWQDFDKQNDARAIEARHTYQAMNGIMKALENSESLGLKVKGGK